MAICDPCKEDHHERCQSKVTLESWRKGKRMGSRTAPCECVCKLPPNWRGEGERCPRLPR